MASKKSDASEPVQSWELTATQKQVDQHEVLLGKVDGKLDTILQAVTVLPTVSQVEDKIRVATVEWEKTLSNAIERQDLKYNPIVSNNKWLLRLLIASGLSIVGALVILVVSVLGKNA